ncbi:WD repeat protein [Ceratobasidium sp. AG-Ba]|nr:WD repeat protein [Ceratobasidium sp. AG-Ba]
MFTRSQDVRHKIRERYQLLGSESLWKSLDEVDVLGCQDRTSFGHTGCVNALSWTPDGELLLSSGDDCRLLVWKHDPSAPPSSRPGSLNLRCVTAIRTGHSDNVFSAHLLSTHASLVATCARDRQVRVFDLERAGGTSTKDISFGVGEVGASDAMVYLLRCHTRQVKRVVTENSPSIFLSVAGDRTVRQHDLRSPHSCPHSCRPPLVKVTHALNALALSSLTPWYFAVAGEDAHGHLFDRRMVGRNLQEEQGLRRNDELVTCVARFGREASREQADPNPHVTGARMAQTNGHEALVAYSGDAVYQYSIYDSPTIRRATSIIPPNDTNGVSGAKQTSPKSYGSHTPEIEEALTLESLLAEHMDTSDDEDEESGDSEEERDDSESEDEESNSDGSEGVGNWLRRPIIMPAKEYRGAANVRTVKDVNFLGPNDEFVTSGSDDGNWFLWSKKSGSLLGIWEGDGEVVNMVEGHPFLPIVATSGIDSTIKIFEPTPNVTKSASKMYQVQTILERNERDNTNPPGFNIIAALQLLQARGQLPDIDGGPECQTQ